MTTIRLLNGPCDPRDVEMVVTADAAHVSIRPMPFDCFDVYAVTDKFFADGIVTHATGEYLYTSGARTQREAYRKQLVRIGAGRAFKVKKDHAAVH